MQRQQQSSAPYTMGSTEHATPRVVSMLKNTPFSGRSEGVNLKQDIMSTLNFINDERNAWHKMQLASMMLAKTMSRASLDDVAKLNHRWQEVSVLCQIQRVKRESLKYNTELQRTFLHGTVDNLNIKRKIVRPEHFERGTPYSLKTSKLTSKTQISKNHTKPIVNQIRGLTSPWEGSQFKYELLCSLRAKLIKKLVLAAFRCHKQMQHCYRQCIATCQRSKLRRLMQLCFSALLLEALSAKYIVFAANVNTRKLVARKYLLPSLHALQRFVHKAQHATVLNQRSDALYRKSKRRAGYRLLLWHAHYMQRSRVYTKWASKRIAKQTILKAFSAWMGSFIEKNKLRQQIYERYSHNNVHAMHETTTSMFKIGNAALSQDTPLKRVLEQSPLQNLRTAVSFFIDYHTKSNNNASTLQRSIRLPTKTDSGDANEDISSSSEDENKSIHDLNLSKSCQKALNTHSKNSERELRTELQFNNNHPPSGDGHSYYSDDSINLLDTIPNPLPSNTTAITTTPSLHNNMVHVFRSCLYAKKLFPQSRFDNSAFNTTSVHTPTYTTLNNTNNFGATSGDTSSSSDSSSNNIVNHASTASAKWRNRFTDKDDYISSGSSEHNLNNTNTTSIEDLLLNQTNHSLSTPSRLNTTPHSAHARNTTTQNTNYDTTIQSGGLMDRAIHESFVLSPHKSSSAHNTTGTPSLPESANNVGNANNGTKSYFSRVTTSGRFCAEVEVDSDIETQLAESFKHASNNSIHISGCYKGVDEAARRLAVQRRFVTQIQGVFQMIKFQWLVRSCRRFVRTLHRQARLRKQSYLCAKMHNKHTRARCLRVWCDLYDKHEVYNTLCSRIYTTKLCKRLLHAWHSVSIRRLVPAYTHTYTLSLANTRRRTFHIWRALYVQRLYQNNVNKVLARGKKVRILAHWRVYVAMVKRSKHIHQVMRSRTLGPLFKQWRSKYKQRLLLSRVFSLHDAAWDYRQYTVPSPFQRLYAVLSAWKQYTGQKLRIRRQETNQRRALYFRGITLLATHYHRWVDAVCSARRHRRQHATHQRDLKTRCFHVWAEQTKHLQHQLRALQHSLLTTSPLRRILHHWHRHVQGRCKTAPIAHYSRSVVQKTFDCLKTLRPLRLMEERKVHACETSRLRISLQAWRGLFVRTQRYQKGLSLLASAFYKLKRKIAYFSWPGRAESLLARQMQEYIAHKHKNRIMLVENANDRGADNGGSAEHKAEITSFLSKKRPTFAYRATKYKFIENIADVKGLNYYRELCTTILLMWSASAKKDISVRYRAFMVRHALQVRNTRKFMMHWVLATPKTSYRRVVWMLKSAHKPHDDYEHKKEQNWVFNHAVQQRTEKNGKHHATTAASKRRSGSIDYPAKNIHSNTHVTTDQNSRTATATTNVSARCPIVDLNNQAINICEGEYYTDTDDSDCDSSEVQHHQVVWM